MRWMQHVGALDQPFAAGTWLGRLSGWPAGRWTILSFCPGATKGFQLLRARFDLQHSTRAEGTDASERINSWLR